jgi:biotin carboxylase
MLASRGYTVDIFAEPNSGALRSKFCAQALSPTVWSPDEVARGIRHLIEESQYDAVYVCSEEVLVILVELLGGALGSGQWTRLPLPKLPALTTLLSKRATVEQMAQMGVSVPKTIVAHNESEAVAAMDELGLPLFLKGDRGESAENVRLVNNEESLLPAYREVARREQHYGGRPSLQERIVGPSFSVAGLFENGRPLRICGHRKLLTFPPYGGWTVKGITTRPDGLLEEAFKVFAAVDYTGLGHTELIRDERDGSYKFIELNPRLWGSVGILAAAGVDFIEPYRMLAERLPVEPDLRYLEGVLYHRFSGEIRLMLNRPQRLPGFLRDALNPRIHSDFSWADLGSHLSCLIATMASSNDRRSRENSSSVDRVLEGK